MLAFRRLLAVSSKMHTYLFTLYILFALLVALALYFPVSRDFVTLVSRIQVVLGWTMFLEGLWIIIASLVQSASSRVLCLQPMLMTVLRMAVCLVLSTSLDILYSVMAHGFSYSGGL